MSHASRTSAFSGAIRNGAVIAALFAPASFASAEVGADTSFQYRSATGDYIGGGSSGSYSATSAHFSVDGTVASGLTFAISDDNDNWHISFDAAAGAALKANTTYSGATRFPFNEGNPGLAATFNSRGCNMDSGTFSIQDLQVDSGGRVTKMFVTFEQNCESATAPALNGTLHYTTKAVPGDSKQCSASVRGAYERLVANREIAAANLRIAVTGVELETENQTRKGASIEQEFQTANSNVGSLSSGTKEALSKLEARVRSAHEKSSADAIRTAQRLLLNAQKVSDKAAKSIPTLHCQL